ncbi:MAG: hypothetical protein GYA02_00555 [Clostridiaceae bacterium]|nr:hypothetical protein [Clostridiaceae bacterium]
MKLVTAGTIYGHRMDIDKESLFLISKLRKDMLSFVTILLPWLFSKDYNKT